MLLLSWGVIAQPASVAPALGNGTSGNPYQIASVENLLWIFDASVSSPTIAQRMSAYYIQTALNIAFPSDINTWNGGQGWNPIGTQANPFIGNYNGQGNKITGLYINRPQVGNTGLFGYLGTGTQANPAVVQNVQLVGPLVVGGRGTGSLVGRVVGNIYTLIEGCSAILGTDAVGTVTGTSATGGLVGANNSTTTTPGNTNNPIISKSYSTVNVVSVDQTDPPLPTDGTTQKIGGLVGCNQKGTTRNSYARGSVTVAGTGRYERVGGLAGCTDLRGRIEYSYATGLVSAGSAIYPFTPPRVGGLVGFKGLSGQGNHGVTVDSYWDTQTTGQTTSGEIGGGTTTVGGLTTTQMKVQANFVGFDFTNIWSIVPTENDGYPILQGVVLTSFITWTGNVSTVWGNINNWNPIRTFDPNDIAVVPADRPRYPIITSSETITTIPKEIDVLLGASITIEPNGKFTVPGRLRSDLPGLILLSNVNGTGSLIHGSDEIKGTIYRHITGAPIPGTGNATAYHTVSVPLSPLTLPEPVSGLFIDSYLYSYDANTQNWFAYGAPTTTTLTVDKGYLIYYPEDVPRTYTFTGTLNNGEFKAKTMPVTAEAHHLVPNPYPSAINWNATAGWTKTNLYNAIWIWNPNANNPAYPGYTVGNYASYINGTGTNGATQFIPVGQAFFVQANQTGNPVLSMNNDVRVHNDQAFFKDKEQQTDILRIVALANNYMDEIVVRFSEGATNNFDSQFDAGKMYGMGGSPQLYSKSADGQQLSINSIPATTEVVAIPVGFQLETDGEVTLTFSSVDSFDQNMPIFLWDNQADKMIDLRQNSQYTFLHNSSNNELRFELLLNSAVSVNEISASSVNILIYYSDKQLHLNIPAEVGSNPMVSVFNTSGQLVHSSRTQTGSSSISLPGISRGIYMVQVTGNGHSVTEKVSVNQ